MYPQGMIYACQDNAWMDERVMLMWVEMVLKPDVNTAPDSMVPILFLDLYHCHMMNSVVNAIQDLRLKSSIFLGAVHHYANLLILE